MNSSPRRSMSQALQTVDLPPEAVALIREGNPTPKAAHPIISRVETKPDTGEPQATDPARNASERPGRPRSDNSLARKGEKSRSNEALPLEEPTVSRSFRLPESLPPALLRAATERRINRVPPWTQEEIVTEAIQQWLKKNEIA